MLMTSRFNKCFFSKLKYIFLPTLRFNNSNISQASLQKYLGLMLDNRLTFDEQKKMC